ncbi:MAG: 16S rRNA (cytosine(967)-C(5))-methyltransferase RsmB [Deltaproteobacteria bacterium]|nr:16S rRNA (cytosine(967)-C(5))-methyltransferase RsmB [Deltaproteobacteria bacterium]
MRDEALRILSRVDRGGAYADILLDQALRKGSLPDPRDRALLTELVMGTLRRRETLDHTLSPHLSRPLTKTDAVVRNALRLGAYQMLYTRIPERVAIFETVAAVKGVRGPKPAGLVNAVLRGVARSGSAPLLPAGEGRERKSAELSAPLPLLDALIRSLGEEEAASFLAASLAKPPFTVRANPFRTTRDALLSRLSEAGMEPASCRFAPDGIVLEKPGAAHADAGMRTGEYLVMDEGAQLIAPLLLPAAEDTVLDACAAPGGKTTHLSALSGGRARIVAADLSLGRVRMLRETLARLGVPKVTTAVHDFSAAPLPGTAERFHRVLVDAPCTGMGVIRRNPDAKWRFAPDDPGRMAVLQRAILRNVWPSLARGGLLVYSTCSPLREENEEVVEAFRRETGAVLLGKEAAGNWPGPTDAWTAEGCVRLSPHRHGTDYFFAALLRKG